jgi:hypothetical protein
LHHRIVRHAAAFSFALAARFGAHAADPSVKRRSAKHEPCARLTNLGAIIERANVAGLGVLSSQLETVLHGLRAGGITGEALVDALLHLFRDGEFGGVRHVPSSFDDFRAPRAKIGANGALPRPHVTYRQGNFTHAGNWRFMVTLGMQT